MLRLTRLGKPSAIWNGKVFAWLLLADKLNTRNMLRRRHYRVANDYACLLCDNPPEETLAHLFFACPFSSRCWNSLGVTWQTLNADLRCCTWANKLGTNPCSWKLSLLPYGGSGCREMTSPSEEFPCKHYPTIKTLLIHACTPSEDHNHHKKSSLLKLCMLIYMIHLCLCCLLFESIVNGYQNFL